MCGIVGIVGATPVNQSIYDALTVLQHRGQDAAGIITIADGNFKQRKANGLVKDVFESKHMQRLKGDIGIGHVRYPTAGSSSAAEAQPFYVNSPWGMALAHNGNLTNATDLRKAVAKSRRHINTTSDSEVLLNVFAAELNKVENDRLTENDIFDAVSAVHEQVSGAYGVVSLIIGHGMVAFRDPDGIRPLVLGSRKTEEGDMEYIVASESVGLDTIGFQVMRDVEPGEAIYITEDRQLFSKQCASKTTLHPCIFEYVYLARPDSTLSGVSVYEARLEMGRKLGAKIKREWADIEIDAVIPIPETSNDIALEISVELGIPYRQGFVKNRYIGRTFIMPGQTQRRKSVRRKLNAINAEFKGKSVLLVDDSIVRGTTSEQIVEMVRDAGAKNVYFASAAPQVCHPNVYGIDMPTAEELIAYNRSDEQISDCIGSDKLIFQDLQDLKDAVHKQNPAIDGFECSVFDGVYVTGDVDKGYFDYLASLRSEDAKQIQEQKEEIASLEMHNED
ncbi:amidophosphoribosyltransferase [Psychromonas sp. psych-6C06]|uniref:amidophosphoribosyltransferase n=1 Tax=Psychromonas sp. psych-6C06 TaxID=2058089 RepID=UPI000C33D540|nr:amidophosphoribosyltransferase [Psychromonas sp. psych-6C06]PKF63848.1 amidophosphoribosyltransferase [Psychromonas sp. psych-6C06]